MEYRSAIKKEFESVLVTWMNLEAVIQSEVSQRKTLYINTYMKSRKMVLMNLLGGKEWRCRYREWTYEHSWGRREWDEWRK